MQKQGNDLKGSCILVKSTLLKGKIRTLKKKQNIDDHSLVLTTDHRNKITCYHYAQKYFGFQKSSCQRAQKHAKFRDHSIENAIEK